MLCLRRKTNDDWINKALSNMEQILTDQINYEQHTVFSSQNLLREIQFDENIAKIILKISVEEHHHANILRNFVEKHKILLKEGDNDIYLTELNNISSSSNFREIDLLLIPAIMEARYCERLNLLIENFPNEELSNIFSSILTDEVNHYSQYIRIAKHTFNLNQVSYRLDELCEIESDFINKQSNKPYFFG